MASLSSARRRIISSAPARLVPTNYQLVGTSVGVPNLLPIAMGGSNTSNQYRIGHDIGPANISRMQIMDAQFRIVNGSGVEASSPLADSTNQRRLEIGTKTFQATYDGVGNVSKVLSAGGLIRSDDIVGAYAPAGTRVFTRGYRTVPLVTDSVGGVELNGPASQGFRTTGANQIAGNGSLNNSGTDSGPAAWPFLLLGVPDRPMGAVMGKGDSILEYLNDTNTSTTQGFFTRTFNNVGGQFFPWHKQAVNANKLSQQIPANSPLQLQALPYVTVCHIQLGTNDLAANADLPTMKANFIALATAVKNTTGPYGLPVLVVSTTIIRRTTFTGAQNTVKDAYNLWLMSGADGYSDFCVDIIAAAGDPTNYTDGIHPRSVDHANIAIQFSAAMLPFLVDPLYRPEARLAA